MLQVGGLSWATSALVLEQTLLRRRGVLTVEANASSQTAIFTYDPDRTNIAELSAEHVDPGPLSGRRNELESAGQAAVLVAMSGSSLIVAANALMLKRLKLP